MQINTNVTRRIYAYSFHPACIIEYPGSVVKWAAGNNHTTSFTKITEQPVFPSMDQFDMLTILGYRWAYEEEKFPWIIEEKSFIDAAIGADKKVLGMCFGSQLIAYMLGTKVYPHTVKKTGWWPCSENN